MLPGVLVYNMRHAKFQDSKTHFIEPMCGMLKVLIFHDAQFKKNFFLVFFSMHQMDSSIVKSIKTEPVYNENFMILQKKFCTNLHAQAENCLNLYIFPVSSDFFLHVLPCSSFNPENGTYLKLKTIMKEIPCIVAC